MKKLNLDVIRLDGDTQPREKLDDERVDLYAENMKDGDVVEIEVPGIGVLRNPVVRERA